MKTLILIRHAKSSWDHPHLSDFERPLNKRGKHDAPLMGKILTGKGIVADQVISSSANRALSTAQIISTAIAYPIENIAITKALYHASAEEIIAVASTANDQTSIFAVDFEIESWAQIIGKKGTLNFYEFPKLHK